jgi:hypothetical protein
MARKKTSDVPVLMTLRETQKVLPNVSYMTIWKWARDGHLPTVTIGKKVFVQRAPFERMLKGLPPERPAA